MNSRSPVEPPEDLSDEERAAWRAGAIATARALGMQAYAIAEVMENSDDTDVDDADDEPECCGECGATLVDGLGGSVCPNCDF